MLFRMVQVLTVFSVSFSDNQLIKNKETENHGKGDSFFSQSDQSDASTCRKHGNCQVRTSARRT